MIHPTLKSFQFCPACGSANIQKLIGKKIQCDNCNFSLFLNPGVAVSLVLYNEKDELLIATRAHNPGINMLDLPGGFIDPFETAEEAARREIKEELDIELAALEYIATETNLYPYDQVEYQTVDIGYASQIHSNIQMVIDPEIKKIEWVHFADIQKENFAFASPYLIAQKFIEKKYNLHK